jgi:hypothetical protein
MKKRKEQLDISIGLSLQRIKNKIMLELTTRGISSHS